MNRMIDQIMELAEPHRPARYRAYLETLSTPELVQRLKDLRGEMPKGQIEFWNNCQRNLKPELV
jgi:hypothetical protein